MREKNIILCARIVSIVFTPFYLPLVGLLSLFFFSYLSQLPFWNKLWITVIVYLFTVLFPTLLIRFYRKNQGWSRLQLGTKERRVVPYVISILCYFCCYFILYYFHIPYFMAQILVAALMIQIICAIINVWWKISTHTAAIGGLTGGLIAFSLIFLFNPVWWLCLTLIIAGILGTSRMILRQHTLTQVVAGFFVGLICGFFFIIY